ncbi:MAG: hypothetical protein COW84_09005 [Gammaproteobacteria bacterium CG22_combo_CG10-13_8_21_14_all_40_8]|nr:MAG: hypothetical protein COW84_09005 [Gammaproteobacteria bacterium CG22_combo_CG10-13_8_21_14_all_40_8]
MPQSIEKSDSNKLALATIAILGQAPRHIRLNANSIHFEDYNKPTVFMTLNILAFSQETSVNKITEA